MFVLTVLVLLQIKPLVGPTKDIMRVKINNFKWHEFFPRGKKNEYVACVSMFHSAMLVSCCYIIFSEEQYWCCHCSLGSGHSCKAFGGSVIILSLFRQCDKF